MEKLKREVRPGRRIATFVPADQEEDRGVIYRACAPIDRFIESHPLSRLIAIFAGVVTVAVTLYTAFSINVQLSAYEDERLARQEERIGRAQDRLLTPAGGDTGKGRALTELHAQDALGFNLDLSCVAIGGARDGSCTSRPLFTRVSMSGDYTPREHDRPHEFDGLGSRHPIDYVINFAKADILEPQISGLVLKLDMFETSMQQGFITDSFITADFEGAELSYTDLSGSHLHVQFEGAELYGVHLSGTVIYFKTRDELPFRRGVADCAEDETAAVFVPYGSNRLISEPETGCAPLAMLPDFSRSWFWADRPPLTLPHVLTELPERLLPRICDPRGIDRETDFEYITRMCREITREEAIARVPDRWDVAKVCDDAFDRQFIDQFRRRESLPCTTDGPGYQAGPLFRGTDRYLKESNGHDS